MIPRDVDKSMNENYVPHRVQIPVECPRCHWRHFVEVQLENLNPEEGAEIHAQLERWVASRCPAHLGPIMEISKN